MEWFYKVLLTILVSVISVPIAIGVFVFIPGFNSLPWSFMEGALFVTFPLFFATFTLVYYLVAKGMLKVAGKMGLATTSGNAYS